MGPRARYLGPEVPAEELIWQDPVPAVDHELIDAQDIANLKATILASGLSDRRAGLDRLGVGLDLPRLRQARRGERGTYPSCAAEGLGGQSAGPTGAVLETLEGIQTAFNAAQSGGKKVSLADLIVLGGCAAVEQAAQKGGHRVEVPFTPGRTDASQEQTDVPSFAYLEPVADGFRNYLKGRYSVSAEELLVDRAQLLTLTAPEMTVLVGGMRALDANFGQSGHGVFTQRPGTLTNDFFVNLLDMGTAWKATSDENVFEGRDRKSGELKWTGTRVDLIFGSHSQLRALAEVYACDGSQQRFVRDFVAAWNKMMNLDRFDLA